MTEKLKNRYLIKELEKKAKNKGVSVSAYVEDRNIYRSFVSTMRTRPDAYISLPHAYTLGLVKRV